MGKQVLCHGSSIYRDIFSPYLRGFHFDTYPIYSLHYVPAQSRYGVVALIVWQH